MIWNMIWRLSKDLGLPEIWPYGDLKGPEIENKALKNNILSSLRLMDDMNMVLVLLKKAMIQTAAIWNSRKAIVE